RVGRKTHPSPERKGVATKTSAPGGSVAAASGSKESRMIRVYALTSALALAVVLVGAGVDAADEKVPTIKDIMKKAHGKEGLRGSITKAIKEKKWDEAAKTVKEWELLGSAL